MQKINEAHSGDFCVSVRKADFNTYLHAAALRKEEIPTNLITKRD